MEAGVLKLKNVLLLVQITTCIRKDDHKTKIKKSVANIKLEVFDKVSVSCDTPFDKVIYLYMAPFSIFCCIGGYDSILCNHDRVNKW